MLTFSTKTRQAINIKFNQKRKAIFSFLTSSLYRGISRDHAKDNPTEADNTDTGSSDKKIVIPNTINTKIKAFNSALGLNIPKVTLDINFLLIGAFFIS
jgi:hypothetical protein